MEGVITRSFLGQFVCPFVASSHTKRPASSSLARSALDRCALHFVTESMWASSPMSRKQSQICLHTSACGLRAAVHHFGPRSRPLSTVAQSDTNVAPGSDKMKACHSAHNSARKIRRCTGREIGMAPCAEQTNSWEVSWICATAHPACPTLGSMLAHQGIHQRTAYLQNCCRQHLGVSTHESYHRACVQECTSQQGRASGLSPT